MIDLFKQLEKTHQVLIFTMLIFGVAGTVIGCYYGLDVRIDKNTAKNNEQDVKIKQYQDSTTSKLLEHEEVQRGINEKLHNLEKIQGECMTRQSDIIDILKDIKTDVREIRKVQNEQD